MTRAEIRTIGRRVFGAALFGLVGLFCVPNASAYYRSTSGQYMGTACGSTRYTIPLYEMDFESPYAQYYWSMTDSASGSWRVGRPQASSDSLGYKQLWYTPSQQLDPRFYIQGPNAFVTGLAASTPVVGRTYGRSYNTFATPSDRTVYLDFAYYFAHGASSTAVDSFSFGYMGLSPHAGIQATFAYEMGGGNKNASWTQKRFNLSAMGLSGIGPSSPATDGSGYFTLSVTGAAGNMVEAAIDDILVYYCQ